jgi:hypothetical protein
MKKMPVRGAGMKIMPAKVGPAGGSIFKLKKYKDALHCDSHGE